MKITIDQALILALTLSIIVLSGRTVIYLGRFMWLNEDFVPSFDSWFLFIYFSYILIVSGISIALTLKNSKYSLLSSIVLVTPIILFWIFMLTRSPISIYQFIGRPTIEALILLAIVAMKYVSNKKHNNA